MDCGGLVIAVVVIILRGRHGERGGGGGGGSGSVGLTESRSLTARPILILDPRESWKR
jgi:hypothetical protein